jgi:hypothetical protein
MKKIILSESEKNQIKSMYGLITEVDDTVHKKRCYEYNSRVNNPVTANAGDIQKFLKNIGYGITVDFDFGKSSATAFGTFWFGADKGIDSVDKLWKALKNAGNDVGTTSGFGPKMAKVVADKINYIVPTKSNACKSAKMNLTIYDITDYDCRRKINAAWNNSITWWKNKLNEPAFYQKLKRINKWDDATTKKWVQEYKNHISGGMYGPFCLKSGYDQQYIDSPGTIAYATWGDVDGGGVITSNGCKISYNRKYSEESQTDMESTIVHEIQHCLYDVKPMTPHTSWKKVFPKATWGSEGSTEASTKPSYTANEKHGVYANEIKKWENYLSNDKDSYTCEETENSSRINGLKKLLGYKTSQKITVNDFKQFLKEEKFPYNDEQAYWLCLCWVQNGAPDIAVFLDNLDKNVVAKDETDNATTKDNISNIDKTDVA